LMGDRSTILAEMLIALKGELPKCSPFNRVVIRVDGMAGRSA
jgi:hypothetical protein